MSANYGNLGQDLWCIKANCLVCQCIQEDILVCWYAPTNWCGLAPTQEITSHSLAHSKSLHKVIFPLVSKSNATCILACNSNKDRLTKIFLFSSKVLTIHYSFAEGLVCPSPYYFAKRTFSCTLEGVNLNIFLGGKPLDPQFPPTILSFHF